MDFTNISFPGLGIEAFKVKSIAFSIGSLQIAWSTVIFAVGAVLAFFYAAIRGKKKEGVSKRRILAITAVSVVLALIVSRGVYVLNTLESVGYSDAGDVLAFWEGLSFAGALVGGAIGVFMMGDFMKLCGIRLLDMLLPGVMLIQLLMAVGTFFDAEIYGPVIGETTSLYLFNGAKEFASAEGSIFALLSMQIDKGGAILSYHPVFLYELVWNLIGFLILHFTYKKARFDGQVSLLYFTWVGIGGVFAAMMYEPATTIFHYAQLAALIVGLGALIIFIVRLSQSYNKGVSVEGEVVINRNYLREMNAEEREARKQEDDVALTAMLDKKANKSYIKLVRDNEEEQPEA